MTPEHTIAPVPASGPLKPVVPAEAPKAPRSGGLRRRLGLGLAVVILAGAGVWVGVFRSRGPADDLGRLQGDWVLAVSGRAEDLVIRIEGNRLVYVSGGQERSAHRIELGPASTPQEIDLISLLPSGQPKIFTDGPGRGTEMKQRGVYTLEGDSFVMCLVPVQEGPRPTRLDDPAGPPPLVLRRAK